jgi:hypothetical protein
MGELADMTEERDRDNGAMTSRLLGRRGVVENAIEIEATPEAVFDYCTDVLREPEWNPKLLEVEKLTAGPVGLGTRFRIRLDGVGWSTTENIAFHRPNFCAATSASKRLDVRIEWEVRPMERGTILSVRTLLLPHGVLRLGQAILRRFMWHQWEHHLRRIKARLELGS